MDSLQTFQDLIGPTTWPLLLAAGTLRSFRPGQVILHQGDSGGFVFVLEAGRVKLLAYAEDGAQLLLTVRGAGQLLGELAGADGRRTATVQAMDLCTARYLTVKQLELFLVQHSLSAVYDRYVTNKFDQAVTRQVDLAHRSALRRIARLFYDVVLLAPATASEPMRLPFTQDELAASLGLARSTVAKQLGFLRRSGALAAGRQLVVADLDLLADFAVS